MTLPSISLRARALQLRQNGQQPGESSAAEESQVWDGMAVAKSGFPWSMHVSMALVTVAAFLFFEQRDSSALIRKLVWSIIIPVRQPQRFVMTFTHLMRLMEAWLCACSRKTDGQAGLEHIFSMLDPAKDTGSTQHTPTLVVCDPGRASFHCADRPDTKLRLVQASMILHHTGDCRPLMSGSEDSCSCCCCCWLRSLSGMMH